MKRIKSFTILELVIAMLISSIVLSISYYALGELNNRFGNFIKRSNQLSEFRLFEKAIQQDVNTCSLITRDNETLFFKQPGKSVSYVFSQEQIVRVSEGYRSVFEIGGEMKDQHFHDENNAIIDHLVLSLNLLKEQLKYHLNKRYTSVELLDAKIHVDE